MFGAQDKTWPETMLSESWRLLLAGFISRRETSIVWEDELINSGFHLGGSEEQRRQEFDVSGRRVSSS